MRWYTNTIVLDRVFMAVALKGTVILSTVKENATMKWTYGTQTDTMGEGRRGLLGLAGLYSIVEVTKIFFFFFFRNMTPKKTQSRSQPTVCFFPPVWVSSRVNKQNWIKLNCSCTRSAGNKCNTNRSLFRGRLLALISGWTWTWKCSSVYVLLDSSEKWDNGNHIWRGCGGIENAASFFSFLFVGHHILWDCTLMLFSSNGRSQYSLYHFPSPFFFILHGSSPVIHPCQATIPYKASGSPHLASYFHIRSAVTDRVYTGSGLECKPACLCHRPDCALWSTTWSHLPPPPTSSCTCGFPSCYYYFPTFLSTHLQLINSSGFYRPSCSFISPLFSQISLLSAPSISSRQNTKHAHTLSHLSPGRTLEELTFRFGTGTQWILMVHNIYSQKKGSACERKTKEAGS